MSVALSNIWDKEEFKKGGKCTFKIPFTKTPSLDYALLLITSSLIYYT